VRGGTFRFDCYNVYANAPVDAPIPDAPPVRPHARFRMYVNFQRTNPDSRDPSILFRESPLGPHGAIYQQGFPADVPFFGQIVVSSGNVVVGADGAPAHVAEFGFCRTAGWAQCVGCHFGHSLIPIAHNYGETLWFNVSTSALVEASSEWRPPGGAEPPCPGRRVVDRKARNDSLEVAWVAADRRRPWVRLSWEVPIEVSHFVLYGIRPQPAKRTDLVLDDCRITLFRKGVAVGEARSGRVDPEGTTVRVPVTRIDAARIELVRVHGRVLGRSLAGLAEIETIARLALDEPRP